MRVSSKVWSRFITAALLASAVVALPGRAAAQCVGDCGGDGEVSISDLVTGVNIALGSQAVSACPAFANQQNEVTIAQLIQGVNNALAGCPPPADTPTATATDAPATATSGATATSTLAPSATFTATLVPTATATGIPTGTATATATATDVPTGTATATATDVPATATATVPPSGTATVPVPPTATATATLPAATASATATATAVNTATATSSATLSPTATSTPLATATATATGVPPGESAAGRAAIVSTGLGSVQNVVGAIVTILTNDGAGAALTYGLGDADGGAADVDDCPISGTTSQDCVALPTTALTFTLGAANCIAAGPAGGEAEFNGGITINAAPFFLNSCADPTRFLSGTYAVDELNVRYRNALSEPLLNVSADLNGTFGIAGVDASCLVGGLNLSLNGTLFSTLADGAGVIVDFMNTQVVMDQITYNSDCVPLAYRLTFNGPATFTPTHTALVEAWAPLVAGGLSDEVFSVTFATFRITQNATTDPVIVTMSGNMTSDCFGGTIGLSTFAPVAVAAGQLCPDSGALDVTGGGTTARVTYDDGGVTIAPAVGAPEVYPSCLDPALLMCPA